MVVVSECLPLTDRTAQNIGDRYGLTLEEIDAFASRSYRRAAAAGVAESGSQGNPPGRHPRHPQKTSRGVITGTGVVGWRQWPTTALSGSGKR